MKKALTIKDIETFFDKNPIGKSSGNEELKNIKKFDKFLSGFSECKAVLGIDIYRYSQYPGLPQTLIPYLFLRMHYNTIDHCLKFEPTILKA